MSKKMNEYEMQLPGGAAAAFNAQFSGWVNIQGEKPDVIRTEERPSSLLVVCTESLARKVAEAFSGTVGTISMTKENVITIPDPIARKARRPGF